ncbi:phage holin family protein [Stackebrandtia nassauensis]|uniref:Integral membrane protein n=1 Tax=Stackebrandtia nassauensis (strain DSM 44728 / CIP 108903 / NRRL B-16338 / NBRC 102104 / LLR-40K-21) TaxID=446470 RepID=D3Q167_STANL|nr:phage holin family protein [Stackebrandtia nassauensis]ADD45647.1 protein of unknown function DUF1469 [Stackebrandtia nassauensis DSM 44728]
MSSYRIDTTADTRPHAEPDGKQPSIGSLVRDISQDMSRLMRQEVELAKAELRQEAGKAGKAAKMFGAAGFAGYMVAVLLTAAAVVGLSYLMAAIWAVLIMTGVWALIGLLAFLNGRKQLRTMSPVPRQTVDTLKEDAQWLRHPTGSEATSSRPGPS